MLATTDVNPTNHRRPLGRATDAVAALLRIPGEDQFESSGLKIHGGLARSAV